MKRLLSVFCLCVISQLALSTYVFGWKVPSAGGWFDEDLRSVKPQIPETDLDNNVLTVYFPDALENITVQVVSVSGTVFYQECMSVDSSFSFTIPMTDAPKGTYKIVYTHFYGCIHGEFTIE